MSIYCLVNRVRSGSSLAKFNLFAVAAIAVTLLFTAPRASSQVTLQNRVLAYTDFQTQRNPVTASCSTVNCFAPPQRIVPRLNPICPGPLNATCTFYIHLESQDLNLSTRDTGLFQFMVDGAIPIPGPTDPLGFFQWNNNEATSPTVAPASHSYAVVARVVNSVTANQAHPIDVSVSCFDFNANAVCSVTSGLSSLEVNVYTP
jgi:hypothetical protein